MPIAVSRVVLVAITCATAQLVSADTLYRWTDARGVVHVSDQAPADVQRPVEQLGLPDYRANVLPEDHYSISKQLERMQARRRATEQARSERRRAEWEKSLREREVAAAERAAAPTSASPPAAAPVYLSPQQRRSVRYRQPPFRADQRHTLWPRDHPAYRPWLGPPRRPHGAPGRGYGARIELWR